MADSERLRDLHQSGTLHRQLLVRVRILSVIGVILLGISLFDALQESLNVFLLVMFAVVGFVLGVTVFSRMSKVVWDEEQETISTGRMDMFGIFAIAVYIAFDIGVRHYLPAVTGAHVVTGYILAALGGALLGRSIGTRTAIYRALGARGKERDS